MAIILPHGVLFRGGKEAEIRTKLLKDGHIDTVIGLPANLFYSTGIPVCVLVLKRCKKPDDVLFINAAEHFEKGKRQNYLTDAHIHKIIETYQNRPSEIRRYARRVEMKEIIENNYNLNISRYVSTAEEEAEVDLAATHVDLVRIEDELRRATSEHNRFLNELGLPPHTTLLWWSYVENSRPVRWSDAATAERPRRARGGAPCSRWRSLADDVAGYRSQVSTSRSITSAMRW